MKHASDAKPGIPAAPRRSSRAALLVLDVISDYSFPDGPKVLRNLERQADTIARLLEAARRASVPVVYINDSLGPWTSDFPSLVQRARKTSPRIDRLLGTIGPEEGDLRILKPRHSAFYGTPLESVLEQLRIAHLLIVGVSAESCIWITACDAHTRGFDVIVPADGVAGVSARKVALTLDGLREGLKARTPSVSSLRFLRGGLR